MNKSFKDEERQEICFGLLNKFLLGIQEKSYDIERNIFHYDTNRQGPPLFQFFIERQFEVEDVKFQKE